MTRRPLIGLTGRRKRGGDIAANASVLEDLDIDLYYSDYARGVLEAGGLPVFVPVDVEPAMVVDQLDGLVLTGGADIDPARYGHPSETDFYPPEPVRDEYEFGLLERAVELALPTLGICRGLQLINVAAGGTLHQHVPEHAVWDQPTDALTQKVVIEADSALHGMYGATHEINSLHHQTIDQLGTDLVAVARTDDGTIEGIEHTTLPMIAVQWHPEMLQTRSTDPIFRWLVQAAA